MERPDRSPIPHITFLIDAALVVGRVAMTDLDEPGSWRNRSRCREIDPEIFFPEGEEKQATTEAAKAVCEQCPVRKECLEEALSIRESDDHGIWGGLSEKERQEMRRSHLRKTVPRF